MEDAASQWVGTARPKTPLPRAFQQQAALWVAVGSVVPAVAVAVGFRWVGAVAGTQGFGRATLFYGAALLGVAIVAGGIAQSITRLTLDSNDRAERADIWNAALALGLAASATLALLFAAVAVIMPTTVGRPSPLEVFAVALALPCEAVRSIALGQLSGVSRFRDAAAVQTADALLRPVVVVGLASFGLRWTPAECVLVAYALVALASSLLAFVMVLRFLGFGRCRRRWLAAHFRYAYPLVLNGLFGWIAGTADRYVVAGAVGVGGAGIYLAAMNLGARPAGLLGGMVETYLRPALYSAIVGNQSACFWRLVVRWFTIVAATVGSAFALVALFRSTIITLLLAPEFRSGASALILWGFAAGAVAAMAVLPQRVSYGLMRTWDVTFVEVAGTVASLACIHFGGWLGGLRGLAGGLFVGATIRLGLATAVAWRGLRLNRPELLQRHP